VLNDVLMAAGQSALSRIESREHNTYASTCLSEIVTVRLVDTRLLQLFCKYGRSYVDEHSGQRRGPAAEAEAYRWLRAVEAPAARFFGARAGADGRTYLVLEHLSDAARLHHLPSAQEDALVRAAATLGAFHRQTERSSPECFAPTLNRYDERHFAVLGRTVRDQADDLLTAPAVARMWRQREDFLSPLLESPPVLVHGELYTSNVLVSGNRTYLVDWETAGTGAGEVDLATLLLGRWRADARREAEAAYAAARWPLGPPRTHRRALRAARVYALLMLITREARRQERRLDLGWAYDELELAAAAVLGQREEADVDAAAAVGGAA
jgi:aminoglycoside phosphotransferase (APT) family kinase protein